MSYVGSDFSFRAARNGENVVKGVRRLLLSERGFEESTRAYFWATHIGKASEWFESMSRQSSSLSEDVDGDTVNCLFGMLEELAVVLPKAELADPSLARSNPDALRALTFSGIIALIAQSQSDVADFRIQYRTYLKAVDSLGVGSAIPSTVPYGATSQESTTHFDPASSDPVRFDFDPSSVSQPINTLHEQRRRKWYQHWWLGIFLLPFGPLAWVGMFWILYFSPWRRPTKIIIAIVFAGLIILGGIGRLGEEASANTDVYHGAYLTAPNVR